ncbi:MAG: hypothetical protein HQL54_07535 [Magnetococcales bacterium]|nr:hypothetical protein [Magnetococcales bacterium]
MAENPDMMSWIIMGIGALLVLIGFIKIISNGLTLLIWVVLVVVGAFGVNYGLSMRNGELPTEMTSILELLEPGAEMSREALASICEKITEEGDGSSLIKLPQ